MLRQLVQLVRRTLRATFNFDLRQQLALCTRTGRRGGVHQAWGSGDCNLLMSDVGGARVGSTSKSSASSFASTSSNGPDRRESTSMDRHMLAVVDAERGRASLGPLLPTNWSAVRARFVRVSGTLSIRAPGLSTSSAGSSICSRRSGESHERSSRTGSSPVSGSSADVAAGSPNTTGVSDAECLPVGVSTSDSLSSSTAGI